MRRLLAGREMTNAAERDCHAADAGVIVVQRAQGGPDELYEVGMIWEEGVVPERSERFSARTDMRCSAYLFICARWSILGVTTRRKTVPARGVLAIKADGRGAPIGCR